MSEFTTEELELQELEEAEARTSILDDIGEAIEHSNTKNYCETCKENQANGGKCPVLGWLNDHIKLKNNIYKAKQIPAIEPRWGCTSHAPVEIEETDETIRLAAVVIGEIHLLLCDVDLPGLAEVDIDWHGLEVAHLHKFRGGHT